MQISNEDIESARSLSGEMTSNQEQSMFEVKLLLDDEANETYKDYKLLWNSYPKSSLPLKKDEYEERLKAKIETKSQTKGFWRNRKVKTLLPIAAVILLGFILFTVSATTRKSRYTNHIIASNGERKQVELPDHSIITLNSGAQLKYPEVFSDEIRKVWVEGEAYFDVAKDIDRPFAVTANGFVIEVLGTKFNVNDNGETNTVSLESGKVQVTLEASGDKIQLLPREELIWNNCSGEVVKRSFDVNEKTAWKDNILVLNEQPLNDALSRINAFYGVEFVLNDSLVAHKVISGAFENQSLTNFIQTLEFIADVKILPVADKKFSISPNDEE
ncbi:FecR family protein [Zobellia sp. B3R18]|uniref:FecR family protein n=1 Tax=Zobellia sp. B3R18 TaxID=2841568 RepID=UPI001C06F0CB|nr:FecR domain-containing protein [Zobellia sp. B3R18]MBU2973268.1 FecR domain-containing protein [Zobellia sp. B3R18]